MREGGAVQQENWLQPWLRELWHLQILWRAGSAPCLILKLNMTNTLLTSNLYRLALLYIEWEEEGSPCDVVPAKIITRSTVSLKERNKVPSVLWQEPIFCQDAKSWWVFAINIWIPNNPLLLIVGSYLYNNVRRNKGVWFNCRRLLQGAIPDVKHRQVYTIGGLAVVLLTCVQVPAQASGEVKSTTAVKPKPKSKLIYTCWTLTGLKWTFLTLHTSRMQT